MDTYEGVENTRGFVARNVFLTREEYPQLNSEQEQDLAKIIQGTTQSLYDALITEETFHCAIKVLKEGMGAEFPDEYLDDYFGTKATDTVRKIYQDFDSERTDGKTVVESLRERLDSYLDKFNFLSEDDEGKIDQLELFETEQELSIKYSELSDLLSRVTYDKESGQCHVMSSKAEIERAKNILFNSNVGLISYEVKSFYTLKNCDIKGIKYEDLFQEGSLGLMKATEKFKPDRERFATYSRWWIKANLKAYFYEMTNNVRIPGYMIDKINRMNNEINVLTNQLNRMPTDEEIAPKIEESIKAVGEIREYAKLLKIQSIHEKVSSDGNPLIDLIPDEDNDPDKGLKNEQIKIKLGMALSEVTRQESYVLQERYFKERTLEDIGIDLEMTKEGVRKIELRAMDKIRGFNVAQDLKDLI
jgi:RNA polymerase sigma factor (sigma-70 family)